MIKPEVKYEDNHLLIVEKTSGWLVQADATGDETLTDWATEYIRRKYKKEGQVFCHPCHRLDRPVGGLVIFARTSKALERINKMLHDHEIEKSYLAVVQGKPQVYENTLVHWLEKDSEKNKSKAFNKAKGKAKRSELSYTMLATHSRVSLLLIKPKTGRPHQIRVQMKANETPIVGDTKYGFPKQNQDKSIYLHAYKLAFIHPVKKEPIKLISKPKWPDFQSFINDLD